MQCNFAVGLPSNLVVVRNNQNRCTKLAADLLENVNDTLRINTIKIACRLVGKQDLWLIQ